MIKYCQVCGKPAPEAKDYTNLCTECQGVAKRFDTNILGVEKKLREEMKRQGNAPGQTSPASAEPKKGAIPRWFFWAICSYCKNEAIISKNTEGGRKYACDEHLEQLLMEHWLFAQRTGLAACWDCIKVYKHFKDKEQMNLKR